MNLSQNHGGDLAHLWLGVQYEPGFGFTGGSRCPCGRAPSTLVRHPGRCPGYGTLALGQFGVAIIRILGVGRISIRLVRLRWVVATIVKVDFSFTRDIEVTGSPI